MAYEKWLTVTPASSSGDGQLSISATAHTGRVNRTTTVTVTGDAGGAKTISVTQNPKSEFVAFDKAEFGVAYNATSVTVSGTSNSSKLTFSIKGSSATAVNAAGTACTLKFSNNTASFNSETAKTISFTPFDSTTNKTVIKYTAAGSDQKSGTAIGGDPGAVNAYSFSITLTFNTANTATSTETATLTVTGNDTSKTATTTIKRNAAAAFVNLSTNAITLIQDGTAQTVDIDSNASWTVS